MRKLRPDGQTGEYCQHADALDWCHSFCTQIAIKKFVLLDSCTSGGTPHCNFLSWRILLLSYFYGLIQMHYLTSILAQERIGASRN